MQFMSQKQDSEKQKIWQSNVTKHIKCVMRVDYYELHNKVTDIKEFGMKSEVQQYIDYSW